ncbi:cholesterol transport system auxiliary component [Pseudochelatococcus lubricantis]|uniref:Cholesterol transport system auxiliary component n=1 Tax=Pseudochelatococcus lubricantis TaxID=1538102 RepID=A0ABX0UW78_9HYPH|nr:ABC-type transport auxiliary lipoprotein family protein [Pseudochelatococcus lubricantis]NIJ56653.1 cholesterol transport system auxiliary component [Pseudochelatococcus lubricantis]
MTKLAALSLGLAVAACASPPVATFDLAASSAARSRGSGARAGEALTVTEPVALQSLDGNTIVVRGRGGELTMLSDAQWADRLPRLVQAQLLRAFEDAGRLGRVTRPNDGVVTVRQLNTELRQFNIDSATGEAVVEISARVVDTLSGNVLRARVFTGRVPVPGTVNGPSAAATLDAALAKVLAEVVGWA